MIRSSYDESNRIKLMKDTVKQLKDDQINTIVRMAWEDRTPFEVIEARTGLSEDAVIQVMRRELKPKSFRLWRKRVSGRITKHRKRFERRMDSFPPEDAV